MERFLLPPGGPGSPSAGTSLSSASPSCSATCIMPKELDKLKGHVEAFCQVEGARHQDFPAACTWCDDLGFHDCLLSYHYVPLGLVQGRVLHVVWPPCKMSIVARQYLIPQSMNLWTSKSIPRFRYFTIIARRVVESYTVETTVWSGRGRTSPASPRCETYFNCRMRPTDLALGLN